MHPAKQLIYVCLTLFLAWPIHAQVNLPGDVPYYRLRDSQTLYIYDAGSRDFIDQLAAYNQAMRAMYDKSFGWSLDEEMDLILLSPRQQVTNAYATVFPNLKTVWYPSGVAALEEMAESSWLLTLASHETAHLYQLNAKGRVNGALKKFLGNSLVFFPFVWPVFIHPNILTPTFLLEGNAVMNESRLNMGGRLHSGEKRALVLAQIAAGKIDANRLINDGFHYPFGEESYMQGAYFQAHLAAKYGVEKTNSFFRAQGERYFWPLILNKTFREHFGESYPQEIREYVRSMEALAAKQQSTGGAPYALNWFAGPMNHDAEKIFFLMTNAKKPTDLYIFDKKSKTFTVKNIDLNMGKVFWEGETPVTASSDDHDLHHIEYSLYGEDGRLYPAYRGQFVTDKRAGKTAALDAADAWLDPHILVNGEAFDIGHSGAILDESGNLYYFRQNGSERLLYKNREPVIKFDGFYAKPMEVTPDGTFYFIGNTDYGSTLYQLRGKEIVRVLKSDRVVDARWIAGNEFLVMESGPEGHSVLIATADRKAQNPAVYSYGFTTQNLIPAKAMDKAEVAAQEREYNSLREIRFSALDLQTAYSSDSGLDMLAGFTFTDPMEHQQFLLMAETSETGDDAYLAMYSFTKYLPDFFVGYMYEDELWRRADGLRLRGYDQEVMAGVRLPLWRLRDWYAEGSIAALYEKEDISDEEVVGSLTNLTLQYQMTPGLGFLPWREFTLSYINRLETEDRSWTKKDNTSLAKATYTHGFPLEFYAHFAGTVAWAENHDIEVDFDPMSLSQDIRIPRLTSHNELWTVKTAGAVRLEVNKVFTVASYSARIPVGLSRIAPVVVAQGIFLDNDRLDRYPASTFEWGYGADLEILLFHRVPLKTRILQAYDTRYPDRSEEELRVMYKKTF